MANVEFFTGFEGMGTTADLYTFFNSVQTQSATYTAFLDTSNGYDDSNCLDLIARMVTSYGSPWIEKEVTSDKIKVVGFHCKIPGANIYADTLLTFQTSSGDDYVVKAPAGGTGIAAYKGGTKLEDSGGIGIPDYTISHLEVKVFTDSVNGYFGVKLNGILVIDYSGPLSDANIIAIRFHGLNTYDLTTRHNYFDNLFIADDWVGECRTALKLPMVDVIAEFEPSNTAAYNYEMVDDEGGHDSDTTYNETDESAMDLFEFQDLDENVLVRAVSLVAVARKTDVSEYPVMLRFLGHDGDMDADSTDSSGVVHSEYIDEMYFGDEFALDTVYPQAINAGYFQCFAQAPNGSAWTRDIFNEYLWGYWGRVPVLATSNFDGKVKLIENLTFDGKAVIE